MPDAIPIGRRQSAAQPKFPPPREREIAAKLPDEQSRKDLDRLIESERNAGIRGGRLWAVPALILGLALGWLAYDQTVARVMSQAQDMALKTQITKGMMESQIQR